MPKMEKSKNKEPNLQNKVREAEVKNILQKLKSGKTLTSRESQIISDYAEEQDESKEKLTQRSLAKLWGMTQPNICKMVKAGMPMTSVKDAEEWRKEFLKEHGRGDTAPASLNDARLRKTLLECERIEFALAADRGEYIKNVEVREAGIKIGAIFTAKLAALVNDSSGALAGLDEASLRKKLHERTQTILAEIRTELEKV
jgi:hypothetical protein